MFGYGGLGLLFENRHRTFSQAARELFPAAGYPSPVVTELGENEDNAASIGDQGKMDGNQQQRVPHNLWTKRSFDTVLSALGLLLSAPLWAVIAFFIKLDDGGPVFYGQKRVGCRGKCFKSWKFRSMIPDADKRYGNLQAKDADDRVTRIGRWLRATAMDELPQLWNIFVGDMSFVGPRALVPVEAEVMGDGREVPMSSIPGYQQRHLVRPGLTGVAQVYAPRDIPRKHKFKMDLLYVRKRSFCWDMKLIMISFWITFCAKWESREEKF